MQTTTPFSAILQETNQINDDGSHTFGYVSEDGSFRTETRFTDGTVSGQYGYVDPDGVVQVFNYGSGRPFVPVNAAKSPAVASASSSEEAELDVQRNAVDRPVETVQPEEVESVADHQDDPTGELSFKEQLSQLTIPEPLLQLARLNVGDQLEQFSEPQSRRQIVEMALRDLQDQMTKLELPQKLKALGREDLSDRLVDQARQWSSYLSVLSDPSKN